jgi:hypothetical protein
MEKYKNIHWKKIIINNWKNEQKTYFDKLPEDCLRLIYKFSFDECLKTLPKKPIKYLRTYKHIKQLEKLKTIQNNINVLKIGDILETYKQDGNKYYYKIENITNKSYCCRELGKIYIDYEKDAYRWYVWVRSYILPDYNNHYEKCYIKKEKVGDGLKCRFNKWKPKFEKEIRKRNYI